MDPLVIIFIGLGLAGGLLYLGFAPQALRWRFSLGLLGAGIATALWWWLNSGMPIDVDLDSARSVMIIPAAIITIFIGVGLVMTLQGKRRLAALGLGILLPVVIGLFAHAAVVEAQRAFEERRLTALQASLDQHQAIWEANRPGHYRFTVSRLVFCPPGYCPPDEHIEVAAGYAPSLTVEKLFGLIQTGIDQQYDIVQVTYHPELGYPMEIYTYPETLMTDQGVRLTIKDFQIIP